MANVGDRDQERPEEQSVGVDPILGLIGLGRDAWRELGGGDRILAWLRSDDEDARPPWEQEKEGDE